MKTAQQKQEYAQYSKDSKIINRAYNEALKFVAKASKKSGRYFDRKAQYITTPLDTTLNL
ncbi:MAG: hypothetical protein O3B87_02685 [bacterium]|nr:hypothetical protein [bacterium]